jgi:hypothetical protein
VRRALIIAALGSVLLHGLALFSFDFGMFGEPLEPLPLVAEIRLPPPAPTPETQSVPEKSEPPPRKQPPAPRPPQPAREVPAPAVTAEPLSDAVVTEAAAEPETLPPEPTPAPAREPLLPTSGYLKFVVIKESLGMQIGMAEHRWKFSADGSYRLQSRIETSGLAALFKPLRQEHESRGQMGPTGLQPIHFSVLRNGQPRGEDADFDWQAGEVVLERDGSRHPLHPGSQDVLSLNYQLAYLSRLEEGIRIGVVTGKKYEHYALDAMGEEDIDTPAGRFRTLHLRAAGETLTEIWLALDHQRLPVKIRFTDKKGDSYSQVLSEFGLLPQ